MKLEFKIICNCGSESKIYTDNNDDTITEGDICIIYHYDGYKIRCNKCKKEINDI